MWDDLEKRFSALLRPLFPNATQFERIPAFDGVRFRVSWKLENNLNRPSKLSRTIIIVLPQEVLEDYRDDPPSQAGTEKRIKNSVTGKLAKFNPDHDTPKHQSVPVEKWVLR